MIVELALILPILLFVLLSALEMGVLAMLTSGLDNSVFEVSRMIRTGRADAPATATAFKTAVCSRPGVLLPDCMARTTVGVQRYGRFTDANAFAQADPASEFNAGVAGDIIVVKVNYRWPLITPFITQAYRHAGPWQIVVSARTAFKNEPFS